MNLDKVGLIRLKHSKFLLIESNVFISKFIPFTLHIFYQLSYFVKEPCQSKLTKNDHFKALSLVFYSLLN